MSNSFCVSYVFGYNSGSESFFFNFVFFFNICLAENEFFDDGGADLCRVYTICGSLRFSFLLMVIALSVGQVLTEIDMVSKI
jgi:hypothetical protein